MSGMDAFKIRSEANEGVRVPLSTPDGKSTDEWLQIRSVWSDSYQGARSELIRQAIEDGKAVSEAPEETRNDVRSERDRRRRAAAASTLIAGWSFDMEFSQEAVTDFLLEAPQILAHVERIAEDNDRFFGKRSDS